MAKLDDIPRVEITSRAQWRAWLRANHRLTSSIWLVRYKKSDPDRYVPYDDVVEEALCFGWIDGLVRGLDERRSMLLLSPRKPGSGWSRLNKQRVARLITAKMMTPAGQAVIDRAKADGSWSALDASEAGLVPPDLKKALAATLGASRQFAGFSESSRRAILQWINAAKKPETRARRIAETARLAASGRRANFPESRGKAAGGT